MFHSAVFAILLSPIGGGRLALADDFIRLDHASNGSVLFATVDRSATAEYAGLIAELRAGDVRGLRSVEVAGPPLTRIVPAPTELARQFTVRLDVPAHVLLFQNAPRTEVAIELYTTDVDPPAPLRLTNDGARIAVSAPWPTPLCAMSLVHDELRSFVGTCAIARVSIAPGDRVRVEGDRLSF